MKKSKMLDFAMETAKNAGDILMKHFGNISKIQTKSTKIDLVTNADIESETYIINNIKTNFPEHNIITEESEIKIGNSNFQWIIDPLDGTTNYTHNLPIFAVSIGLQFKSERKLGVVYNPAANKCFWAEKNNGSFLNNLPIKVASTRTLSESLLTTGFPYIHDESYDKCFNHFKELYDKTQGIRRLGAASLDFCFVAMGRFEGFWEYGLQPWDVCAGALILEESGGKISDWDGSKIPSSCSRILATNGYIHSEMINILRKDLF